MDNLNENVFANMMINVMEKKSSEKTLHTLMPTEERDLVRNEEDELFKLLKDWKLEELYDHFLGIFY